MLKLFPYPHSCGSKTDGKNYSKKTEGWGNIGIGFCAFRYGDSGSASRFFYCAKNKQELIKYLSKLISIPNDTNLILKNNDT